MDMIGCLPDSKAVNPGFLENLRLYWQRDVVCKTFALLIRAGFFIFRDCETLLGEVNGMWEFIVALFSIVIINLVLSGDNAIVIALASRKLPQAQRKRAILWGTLGAVALRITLTFIVVGLLEIPLLMLIGGLLLIWISFKLLADKDEHVDVRAGNNLWQAVQTIIVADLIMSMDNVLAIAGAAQGNFYLVVIGIAFSIPIIVWGSTMILRLIERFPAIIYVGSGILAYTAGEMLVDDEMVYGLVRGIPWIHYIIPLVTTAAVLAAGYAVKKRGRGPVKQEGVSNVQ